MIDNQEIGQIEWGKTKFYKFQYGDSIDVINNLTGYFKIDEEKQILKHVVVDIGEDLTVYIKAYKQDAEKLNEEELAALTTYCNKIKPVGTKLSVTSTDADKVKLVMVLELNPEIFNDEGIRIADSSSIIPDTIESILSNLPDGMFYISNMIETLKNIDGVKDVFINNSHFYNGSAWVSFSRKYEASSGHLLLDEESNLSYVFD
jgi:diadenosine tetraphosphate (Ap4A) HIT family hydrolase